MKDVKITHELIPSYPSRKAVTSAYRLAGVPQIMTLKLTQPRRSSRHLTAVRFLRKMRGGSQSFLAQAEDGNFYIVKLLGNPQGSRVLFHEALGNELMREIGLPVPKWCPIEITDDFIDHNRSIWFKTANLGPQRPDAGLHFASRFVAPNEKETLYEVLPRSWRCRVRNRADFIGALLFDIWTNQGDNRQAVFLQNIETGWIDAVFIDQGSLFAEGETTIQQRLKRAMYMDPSIYFDLDISSLVATWGRRIQRLDYANIKPVSISLKIPAQWYTPDNFDRIVSGLRERRASTDVFCSWIKSSLNELSSEELADTWEKSLGDIQIHRPQLCSDTNERVSRSLPRVG